MIRPTDLTQYFAPPEAATLPLSIRVELSRFYEQHGRSAAALAARLVSRGWHHTKEAEVLQWLRAWREEMGKPNPNLVIEDHGAICLLYGRTPAVQTPLEYGAPDDALWWNGKLVAERRFVPNVVEFVREHFGESWEEGV